jgi:hypothetical protein
MANQYDFSGKHFEAKAVSPGELEALKRFPDYETLTDGTLMRIEGSKEFRIYPENGVEGFPFNVVTPGLLRELQESYKRRMLRMAKADHGPPGAAAE